MKKLNEILIAEGILKVKAKAPTGKTKEPSEVYLKLKEAPITGASVDTLCTFPVTNKLELKKIKNQVNYAIRQLQDLWEFQTSTVPTEGGYTIYVGKFELPTN